MPGGTRSQLGNELFGQATYQAALAVPNLPASSTVQSTYTLNGVLIGDIISWNQLSYVAGIAMENMFVSAPNTLTAMWSNATTGAINGTPAQAFLIEVTRPENASLGLTALPSAVL